MVDSGESNNKKKQFLNDHQLKELIRTEEEKTLLWQKKWGFMDKNYVQNIHREEAEKLGLQPDFLENRIKMKQLSKDFKTEASPPPPTNTSQFIGWRSHPKHSLEICGPMYVSPRSALKKESYNNIFLG